MSLFDFSTLCGMARSEMRWRSRRSSSPRGGEMTGVIRPRQTVRRRCRPPIRRRVIAKATTDHRIVLHSAEIPPLRIFRRATGRQRSISGPGFRLRLVRLPNAGVLDSRILRLELDRNMAAEFPSQINRKFCSGSPALSVGVEPESAFSVVVHFSLRIVSIAELPSIAMGWSMSGRAFPLLFVYYGSVLFDPDRIGFGRFQLFDRVSRQ